MAQSILDLLLPVDDRDCSFVLELPTETDCQAATAADADADAAGEPATKRQRVEGSPDAAGASAGNSSPCTDRPGEALVGCRIKVFVDGEGKWFAGAVEAYDKPKPRAAKLKHRVRYSDGEVVWEDLGKCRWRPLAETARREVLPACSIVLRQFSCKLRDWAARWTEGGAREYVVQCRDEAEVAGYRQLLDFMHSMGRQLPEDPGDLLQLLLLAREHAVEAAVLASLQSLLEQAPELPPALVMRLLPALDTGVSDNASIQAAADKMAAACCDRLSEWLAEGGAPNAAEQHLLLQTLGPLQEVLNDNRRRDLFCKLPFVLLQDCILDDANVNADTETTVLAATLLWAEAQARLTDSQLAELFSRIRFPAVPAATLVNYHRCFRTLRLFDPDKALLLRAITDPGMWRDMQKAMSADQPDQETAELKKQCGRWWLQRKPRLRANPPPAKFAFQFAAPPENCSSVQWSGCFWAGYWWKLVLIKEEQEVGLYLHPAAGHSGKCVAPDTDTPSHSLYRLRVEYEVRLSRGCHDDDTMWGVADFTPTKRVGYGTRPIKDKSVPDRPPLSWEALWGESSPYCRGGVVRGRLSLGLPGVR